MDIHQPHFLMEAYLSVYEQVDEDRELYELILCHLLDEGYASTEQDAIQIMSNMSEEWADEIVEGFKMLRQKQVPKVINARDRFSKQSAFHGLALARFATRPGEEPKNVSPEQQKVFDKRWDLFSKASNLANKADMALRDEDPKPKFRRRPS